MAGPAEDALFDVFPNPLGIPSSKVARGSILTFQRMREHCVGGYAHVKILTSQRMREHCVGGYTSGTIANEQ